MTRLASPLALALLLAAGCAKNIDPGETDDSSSSTVGAGEATIDATSQTDWVFLDFGSSQVVNPSDPADSTEWDLGLRRYVAQINGGASGTGGMEVVPMPAVDYNTSLDEPTEGWITDEPDADADGDLEYALDSWWEYDTDTHQVTPAEIIYVVRTVERDLIKLEFTAYYDAAGTPGYVQLHWGALSDEVVDDTGDTDTTPDDTVNCTEDTERLTSEDQGDGVTSTQASTNTLDDYVCFDFETGEQVTEGWDMALQKWTFPTTAEVALLEGEDFDALTQAPADGYLTDPDHNGEAFEDWYDYDATEHTMEPEDIVYVVHTTDGGYYKLQFTGYYPDGDTDQPGYPTFRWAAVDAPAE